MWKAGGRIKQQTLTGFEQFAKTTCRAKFPDDVDRVIPWKELTGASEPVYPEGR